MKIWLSIKLRHFGSHVTVRPPVRTSLGKQGETCASLQRHIARPCCGQLTAVKTGYLLTSITCPYRGLISTCQGNMYFGVLR